MLRLLVFVLVIIGSASRVFCAENLDRIRFGYSSISGSRIALWVTSEMGFFSKNGLAAETIVTRAFRGLKLSSPASCNSTLAASIRRLCRLREAPT
jgi:hypothetical protein